MSGRRYFFEPLGSISWNRNSIGDLNLPGAAVVVQFGDVKDLDAGGGFRAGGVIMEASSIISRPPSRTGSGIGSPATIP